MFESLLVFCALAAVQAQPVPYPAFLGGGDPISYMISDGITFPLPYPGHNPLFQQGLYNGFGRKIAPFGGGQYHHQFGQLSPFDSSSPNVRPSTPDETPVKSDPVALLQHEESSEQLSRNVGKVNTLWERPLHNLNNFVHGPYPGAVNHLGPFRPALTPLAPPLGGPYPFIGFPPHTQAPSVLQSGPMDEVPSKEPTENRPIYLPLNELLARVPQQHGPAAFQPVLPGPLQIPGPFHPQVFAQPFAPTLYHPQQQIPKVPDLPSFDSSADLPAPLTLQDEQIEPTPIDSMPTDLPEPIFPMSEPVPVPEPVSPESVEPTLVVPEAMLSMLEAPAIHQPILPEPVLPEPVFSKPFEPIVQQPIFQEPIANPVLPNDEAVHEVISAPRHPQPFHIPLPNPSPIPLQQHQSAIRVQHPIPQLRIPHVFRSQSLGLPAPLPFGLEPAFTIHSGGVFGRMLPPALLSAMSHNQPRPHPSINFAGASTFKDTHTSSVLAPATSLEGTHTSAVPAGGPSLKGTHTSPVFREEDTKATLNNMSPMASILFNRQRPSLLFPQPLPFPASFLHFPARSVDDVEVAAPAEFSKGDVLKESGHGSSEKSHLPLKDAVKGFPFNHYTVHGNGFYRPEQKQK